MHESPHPTAPVVLLEGHLTRGALLQALARVQNRIEGAKGVILDCLEMDGYDPDARQAFVDWLRTHAPRSVAVVTRRQSWHMVTSAMSLASGRHMRAFATVEQARAWMGLPFRASAANGDG